ncbi:MAG TPA: type II toxin-antitoxin system HipA family toxin [Solirubrobacteraceae bacterium]|jgi:serine/threonine-protein kinase HipA|nr:type II toxin-antitoxin system HipA family toxin [Solirubrobacteraceae bacterium]
MATRALDVWLYERRAGRLEARHGALTYAYEPAWVDERMPPLSQSLPVRGEPFTGEPVHAFFANLLPEGDVRRHVARRFGVSVGNDFELLAAIGGDCAGAVSLTARDGRPRPDERGRVRWLDDAELADVVADLPRRPLMADPDEGIRLSLAGAQDKLPVVVAGGRVGVPTGGAPSTHILKVPIAGLDDTVVNEAFCLRLARSLRLEAAAAEVLRVGDQDVLLVERYDRDRSADTVRRLHQEDFCQALAVPPEAKYEAEGGPGAAQSVELLRRASAQPARDVLRFADALVFNLLVGNHDAHGKNYSVLYRPEGTALAPLYDLVSTAAYRHLSRRLAMAVGGEYRGDWVRARHVDRFAERAQLGPAALRRRAARLAAVLPDAARDTVEELRGEGLHRPVLDRIVEVVARRAGPLQAGLATPRPG